MRKHHILSGMAARWVAVMAMLMVPTIAMRAQFSLHDIDIQVCINELGNARISESRQVTVGYTGSEGYIRMQMKQGRQVGELSVTDDTGTKYETLSDWDVDKSRSWKTNKCGIYDGDKGPELCWGVGEAGERVYHVHYTLTRLVKSYKDYDGFLFTFYEAASPRAPHLRITFYKEHGKFTKEEAKIWTFNHYGRFFFEDGKIVCETTQPFAKDGEKMNVMIQFKKGQFKPATQVSATFYDAVKKKALEGSSYGNEDADEGKASYDGAGAERREEHWYDEVYDEVYGWLLQILGWGLPIITLILGWSLTSFTKKTRNIKQLFGNTSAEIQTWYRDLPLGGDLHRSAGVLYAVDSKFCNEANLRRAYILRMLYNKQLRLVQERDFKGNWEKRFYVEQPPEALPGGGPNEVYPALLQRLLYEAAGSDHILQPGELLDYAKAYPVELRPMAKMLHDNLEIKSTPLKSVTQDDVNQVFGLRKYLKEFTLSNERTLEEVYLWKGYLVFATLYGNADQVRKDMKSVIPDLKRLGNIEAMGIDDDYFDDSSYLACGLLAANMERTISYVDSYETPEERAARESRDSSGGGSSSYGGGGGSDGGGGSGFR